MKSLADRASEAFDGVSASVLSTDLCIEVCEALERARVVGVVSAWCKAQAGRRVELSYEPTLGQYILRLLVVSKLGRDHVWGSDAEMDGTEGTDLDVYAAAAKAIESGEV